MNRRDFLRSAVMTGAASAMFLCENPLTLSMRQAFAANGKTLVVIFQRGGCDGLNVVVPHGDPDYYALRPTIAVDRPQAGNPVAALDLDGFFGLHPAMSGMAQMFGNGELAVLPTVQYPNASRSHFSGQNFIENAAPSNNLDGWLNRHLQTHAHNETLRAVSFGNEVSQALRGSVFVSSFNDINNFSLGIGGEGEASLVNRLLGIYLQAPQPDTAYRHLVLESGQTIFNDLELLRNIDTSNYMPANGAVYPNNSYGRQLRQIAQLIKANIGLETVTVNIGGWDTHSDQGDGNPNARQSRVLRSFSDGITALYTDLGQQMDDVVILTMTEFGRTAAENGSFGTDHGNAAAWFALGGGIQGGVYGAWPGLSDSQLLRGRYLMNTVDYRDVMGDIVSSHLGNSQLDLVLPGHSYSPVGLFAG